MLIKFILRGESLIDTNVCDGIQVGDKVTFEVTLEGKIF